MNRGPPASAADATADRGLSPVVGKTLELGVGVLFVALLTATFFGGVAPEYRTAVGAELGDRTLVAATERIEAAVPAAGNAGLQRRVAVRLPAAIRGDPYRIVVVGESPTVRLVHPAESVGGRLALAVPGTVTVSGSWTSTTPSWIVLSGAGERISVRLVDANDGRSRPPGEGRSRLGPPVRGGAT